MIGQSELLLILLVVLILFGASAIPRLARALGKAKSEFEKGLREGREDRLRGPGRVSAKRRPAKRRR